ncbi:MAG: zinc-ribbon domain-containing protein [Candidatus Bathyarchaeia archaeon]
MPVCPQCGATVPEGAIACGNCGSPLNSSQTSSAPFQSTSTSSTTWSTRTDNSDLSTRLEKALRRTELLSYVAIGLAAVILVILLIF